MESVTGIILAGGASRRMGRDKAWMELGGKFLVERVADALRGVCTELLVVTNAAGFEKLDARVVRDEFPNTGSLGGLYSGLRAAQNELAFAVACDMPFLNPALIQNLIALSSAYDMVIPSSDDGQGGNREENATLPMTAKKRKLHPLHAVYRKTCLTPIRDALERNDFRMISFHDAVRVRVVSLSEIEKFDPQHISLWNINTPEEFARARTFFA